MRAILDDDPYPVRAAYVQGALMEAWGRITGRMPIMNLDKVKELRQKSWSISIEKAKSDLAYVPQYNLRSGMEQTIGWYRRAGWI